MASLLVIVMMLPQSPIVLVVVMFMGVFLRWQFLELDPSVFQCFFHL
jgi:hypothetical protein